MSAAPFHAEVADGPEGGRAVWLKAEDGPRIRAALWPAKGAQGTVFLLPGRTEYVEKYGRAAADLARRGYTTLSLDWRGQGLSDRRLKEPMVGHVSDFAEFQQDLAALRAFAQTEGLPEPHYMIAHSMGGCIGLRSLMARSPFKAAAFSAPMWGILISAWMRPFAELLARSSFWLRIDSRYAPGTGARTYVVDSPFAGNTLTSDPDMWAYMRAQALAHPELSLGGPSLGWLRAALEECAALARLPSPPHPVICALGLAEKIVDVAPIHLRMAAWPSGRLDLFPGAEHEVMMEAPATRSRFFDSAAALFAAHR